MWDVWRITEWNMNSLCDPPHLQNKRIPEKMMIDNQKERREITEWTANSMSNQSGIVRFHRKSQNRDKNGHGRTIVVFRRNKRGSLSSVASEKLWARSTPPPTKPGGFGGNGVCLTGNRAHLDCSDGIAEVCCKHRVARIGQRICISICNPWTTVRGSSVCVCVCVSKTRERMDYRRNSRFIE